MWRNFLIPLNLCMMSYKNTEAKSAEEKNRSEIFYAGLKIYFYFAVDHILMSLTAKHLYPPESGCPHCASDQYLHNHDS